MRGKQVRKLLRKCIIAVAGAAAIFAVLYYSCAFLPSYTVWHEFTLEDPEEDSDVLIELKNRKLRVYEDGEEIFRTPFFCKVSNIIYTDIDRDGEEELIILNYNPGRFGRARPFWIKFDPPVYRQHIYIYDHRKNEKMMRPAWMASDIGVKAADFELIKEDVIQITDLRGEKTDWMWISFGLRCVD